jgi:hypothetical protein
MASIIPSDEADPQTPEGYASIEAAVVQKSKGWG